MVLSAIQTPQPRPECRQQPRQDQDLESHVGPHEAGRDLERRQPRHEWDVKRYG